MAIYTILCIARSNGSVEMRPDDASALLSDPETMRAMHSLMSNLDAKDLQAISRQAGSDISEEQARFRQMCPFMWLQSLLNGRLTVIMQAAFMSTQLRKISTEQVAWLVQIVQCCQFAKKVLVSRLTFLVSIAVLLIAMTWKFSR